MENHRLLLRVVKREIGRINREARRIRRSDGVAVRRNEEVKKAEKAF